MVFTAFLTALFAAFAFELFRKGPTGLVPTLRARLSSAFGGQYWTLTQGFSVTGALATTFTHSLGIAPANLYARVFVHQAGLTNTGWANIVTIGTNVVTVAIPVAQTATLLDIEVGQQHSMVS